MLDRTAITPLAAAVQRYFDLMYDADTARFDQVFHPTAQLHGFIGGAITMWPAATYRAHLAGQPSPKSLNAPREEQILLVDFAAADQAVVKVRVRSNTLVYLDHLTWHRIEGDWRVTAKAWHVERRDAAAGGAQS